MKFASRKTPHHVAVVFVLFAAGLLPWHFFVSCDISGQIMWAGLAFSSVAATMELLFVMLGNASSIGWLVISVFVFLLTAMLAH